MLFTAGGVLVSITLSDGTGTVWNDVEGLWEGSAQGGTVSSFAPDGRLVTEVGLDGHTTNWSADGSCETIRVEGTTSYRADGTRSRFVSARGDEVLFDLQGRMASVTRADGSASRYNVDGSRVDLTSTGTVASVTLADGTSATWNATDGNWVATSSDGTTARFNTEGRLLSRTASDGTVTTFAADGTSISTTTDGVTHFRADGSTARVVASNGDDSTYDTAGTLRETHHADGSVTRHEADGSRVEISSAGAVTGVFLSNGVAATHQADGTWKALLADSTLARYAADGHLTTLIDPDGQATSYAVDRSSVVAGTDGSVTWNRADGTVSRYVKDGDDTTYDTAGLPTETHHADGSVTGYSSTGKAIQRTYHDHVDVFCDDGSLIHRSLTGVVLGVALWDGTEAARQEDGTWKGTDAEGTVHVHAADGSPVSATSIDGTTVLHRADGGVETHTPDGTTDVEFQDGSWRFTDSDGSVTVGQADGSSVMTRPDGTQVVTFSDGTVQDHQADGTINITHADNTPAVRHVDGTEVARPSDHVVVTSRPDGSIITRDATGHVYTQVDGSAAKVELAVTGSLSIALSGGPTLSWSGNGVMRTTWADGRVLEDHPGGRQVSTDAQGVVTTTYTSGLIVVQGTDGSRTATYADGTRFQQAASGAVTLVLADGTRVTRASAVALPVLVPASEDSTVVVESDGATRVLTDKGVTRYYLDGRIVETSGGTVTTSTLDGRIVTRNADGSGTTDDGNGTTTSSDGNGTVTTTSYDGTSVETSADGQEVTTFTDGHTRRTLADGSSWEVAADGKGLSLTLADGSSMHRAADGSVTATPAEGSLLLVRDGSGPWVAHLPGGNGMRWATDGSGTVTTLQADGCEVVRHADGSMITTLADGTRTFKTTDGNYVRLLTDGRVAVQDAAGAHTVLAADGTILARNADGDLSRTTPGADGGPGTTHLVNSDGSTGQVSADGSSITRNTDGSTDYTWPDGTKLHVNADGSYEYTMPDGRKYHGGPGASTPAPGDPTGTGSSTAGTDAASNSGAEGTALSSPVSFRLSDGSTVTIDPDGKVTRAYANGDVVTRFPDGVVKKTTAAGVSTTWHPNGNVESSQGDHTQTWDASTGVHVDHTSAATTTYEANGTVTEVREGHTTVTLPSGIVIRDGRCDAIYDVIDGQRSYPGVRFATDDVGYSPPNPPVVVKQRVWDDVKSVYRTVYTYGDSAYFNNAMNVSIAKQQVGIATVVGEEVIDSHSWLGTFLVPPPPAKKTGEVTVDINRNKADEPEALQTQIVNGFTTVTSENVYDNVVDVNLDCQYTFYDADGHVMDRLIADFCDLSLRAYVPFVSGHTPPPSPEDLDDDAAWATTEGHLWSDLGEAPSAATSLTPGSSLLGTIGSSPVPSVGTRTATVIGQDSYDFSSNSQGQLIREATNVFSDGGFEDFRNGGFAGTRADATTGTVALTRIEGTRCPVEGTYTSMIFDAGRTTTFGIATWTADVPAGTSLRFQVAVSSTAGGPWVFVGPDGTAGSYFTSSGTAFTTPPTGRYVCYRATFASDAGRLASPTLSGFNLGLGGATSRVVSYTYGPNGNVISRTSVDSATGTTTDVRDSVTWPASDRINAQNQLLRRDVTSPDGTTVTWRYTYDSAGNMTSKTDGTQTTSYAWDSHNHLVQVTLPDGTTEAYTYDANGLMLSSRRSTDTAVTTYVWRGNDLVQETASDGTVTRYNVVNGVLVSFERGGETYTVQSDATMGHVRSVTDSNGTVVYTARYDAWGNVLAVTDNVPGGMPARYVGALGVRWDATTGLYYMRHRWYDPGLQQFMSVDPLKSNPDLYEYANDEPAQSVDPSGLDFTEEMRNIIAGCQVGRVEDLGAIRAELLRGTLAPTVLRHAGDVRQIFASDCPEALRRDPDGNAPASVREGQAVLASGTISSGSSRIVLEHSNLMGSDKSLVMSFYNSGNTTVTVRLAGAVAQDSNKHIPGISVHLYSAYRGYPDEFSARISEEFKIPPGGRIYRNLTRDYMNQSAFRKDNSLVTVMNASVSGGDVRIQTAVMDFSKSSANDRFLSVVDAARPDGSRVVPKGYTLLGWSTLPNQEEGFAAFRGVFRLPQGRPQDSLQDLPLDFDVDMDVDLRNADPQYSFVAGAPAGTPLPFPWLSVVDSYSGRTMSLAGDYGRQYTVHVRARHSNVGFNGIALLAVAGGRHNLIRLMQRVRQVRQVGQVRQVDCVQMFNNNEKNVHNAVLLYRGIVPSGGLDLNYDYMPMRASDSLLYFVAVPVRLGR